MNTIKEIISSLLLAVVCAVVLIALLINSTGIVYHEKTLNLSDYGLDELRARPIRGR